MLSDVRINHRHVVAETIDDETILIHLGTGIYYSLDGLGSTIWNLAEQGLRPDQIVAVLRDAYPDEPAVDAAVAELVTQLTLEDLLIDDDEQEQALAPPAERAAPIPPAVYVVPSLRKYTDMQEFMLVDPLHEVDEAAGWPSVKAG